MSTVFFVCVWAFLLEAVSVDAGSYCSSRSFGSTRYFYCAHGCCGTYYSRSCCSGWSVPTIVGAVIAGLVILAIIVGVVVACYCGMKKGTTRSGRVIPLNSNQGTTSTIVVNNPSYYQHWHGSYNQPGLLPPPPAYKRVLTPPPAYTGPPTPRGNQPSTSRAPNPANAQNNTLQTLNTPMESEPSNFRHPSPAPLNTRIQHPPPASLGTSSAPPPLNTNLQHI